MNVFKYRNGLVRDIEALMNNQFYSANLESLNDIEEAKAIINKEEIEIFDLLLKSKAPQVEKTLQSNVESFIREAKKYGIYSLGKNYNNQLLWAYYANSHQGFCIEYDLDILKQFQLNDEFFSDVIYQENIPIIDLEDILNYNILIKKLLVTKSVAWKNEEEFRIITGISGLYYFYNRAIKSIYFGYRASENSIKLIMSVLRGKGIKYYQMNPKKDLYELERVEIEDLYNGESIYLNRLNKFIPELSKDIKQYEELICKAIIILEQEPMCKNVTDVGLSISKGTQENPVFFLSFENQISGTPTPNYFISKEEIESIFEK